MGTREVNDLGYRTHGPRTDGRLGVQTLWTQDGVGDLGYISMGTERVDDLGCRLCGHRMEWAAWGTDPAGTGAGVVPWPWGGGRGAWGSSSDDRAEGPVGLCPQTGHTPAPGGAERDAGGSGPGATWGAGALGATMEDRRGLAARPRLGLPTWAAPHLRPVRPGDPATPVQEALPVYLK